MMDPLKTPDEVARGIGERLRELRLRRNWRRQTLAERAGVSPATIARIETTGRITLANLLAVAQALGRLDELDALFGAPRARTIAELAALEQPRQRGRR